jgi:L-asparaginase/Glu-tRNA(Gln) amidotransferase subunit D
MAKDIIDNYDTFDAFVVLHGTDTMAFTASALSFMLENLNKTVFLFFLTLFLYTQTGISLSLSL